MWILYNLGIFLGQIFVIAVAPFNRRIRKWRKGRKGLLQLIEQQVDRSKPHTWFHFASLGEFEQGRTVLEAYRVRYPKKLILVTFFSPSGYEVRANYAKADHVFYLPNDTPGNAKKFIDLINPEMVFFVKYEFWHNYFKVLHKRHIPLYLVSGIFRKNQVFFRWYGGFFRSTLKFVTHFFVQNQESASLLQSIGIRSISLSGDTRFDRVSNLSKQNRNIEVVSKFVGDHRVLVAGSTWLPDEELIMSLRQVYPEWKLIIAPHLVTPTHLREIDNRFKDSVLFSVLNGNVNQNEKNPSVLIIDNIGMLSYLYSYADIAYVGGGFGVGIHNVLEAATYGIPIIFGPEYHKFQEAKDLIKAKAAFSVHHLQELVAIFENLQSDEVRKETGDRAYGYVQQQAGATQRIMDYLET
ncbi:3-deoxy-D-manno-octulosonic acid transferase [Olivibacter sp. SDN3]|uniref:3-deoxy-D-manno-octulosonic acid transferase n=1 Tax=Olivibacter sp. SDN3 TaxID=2764720 RepID=UPI001650D6D7|nr:glycosyltransferase N-terminal domain-containing protein [Olivibacter sp. SDN3]QNL50796.1 3-deoxy-D-manno-octulosonic acid transferase [Olivibacter sp. SDN3]